MDGIIREDAGNFPQPMNADFITNGNVKSEDEHRRDICTVGRWIHSRSFVVATDGNISVRMDSQHILTSPTGMSKGMMVPDDLVITDLRGRKLSGRREPSSELAMHLLIYNRRPDVYSVVHAHPPTATAHAAAGIPLNKALLSELIIALGCIPVAPYGTPGTQELSDALEPMVQQYDAILLANHGVVTCGPDLLTAFFRMETLEHFAQVSLMTELLGKQVLLSGRDVEKLLVARARYGTTTAAPMLPGCPITSDDAANEEQRTKRISITRRELEGLIEEAVRKDRSLR
ncbi:MAG TPA: class II aldolase/adducin family protein [Candidatus Saccharimonadales bacterium]|jgi:L-fuculose-phosphate aldolase|nr:class II aldolase/adducin family protein [Candidatus Saccharimonadales bacterium]